MFKNVAGQSVTLYAVDASTGLPKAGDAANMVFYVAKDDGPVTAIAANSGVPAEVDATNDKGSYKIALAQAETGGDKLRFSGKSTTANVVVVPVTIYTVPGNFTSQVISASGKAAATVASGDGVDSASVKAAIGAAGAGLTALGDARLANLDATVSSRSTYAGGAVASVTAPVALPTTPPAGYGTLTLPSGTVGSGPSATSISATMAGVGTGAPLKGRRLLYQSGSLAGTLTDGCSACTISGTTAIFSFAAAQAVPAQGDTFDVVGF